MESFPIVKKDEIICMKHRANLYKGPLAQRIIEITDELEVLVDVAQVPIGILNGMQQPQIGYAYKVYVREIKNGVVRPYAGDGAHSIFRERIVTDVSNFNYAKLDLSNVWVYSEPTMYELSLRIAIKEPLGATFQSFIITAF